MVKHLCLEIIKQQQIPPLHRELVKAVTSSVKKEVRAHSKGQSLAKYDGARLSLRHFKSENKFGRGSKRISITYPGHVRYRNRHKQSQAKALVLSAILNTWLPRSNFIYSNNTLLTAGCCKSELRYLKH